MLRVPLYNVCLVASVLCPAFKVSIKEFLLKAPSPPADKSIDHALDILRKIGALDATDGITRMSQCNHFVDFGVALCRFDVTLSRTTYAGSLVVTWVVDNAKRGIVHGVSRATVPLYAKRRPHCVSQFTVAQGLSW